MSLFDDKVLFIFKALNLLTSLIHFCININSVLLDIFLSNSSLGISMKTFLISKSKNSDFEAVQGHINLVDLAK